MDVEVVLTDLYRAFSVGDVVALDRLLADDVIVSVPGDSPISGLHQGKAAVLAHLGRIGELTNGTAQAEILRMFVGDGGGVVLARESAVRNGSNVVAEYAEVFHVANGQVLRMDVYPSSLKAMKDFYH